MRVLLSFPIFFEFRECAEELIERDTPGFAIGGLSGGEEKDQFWRMVAASTEVNNLPYFISLKTWKVLSIL